MDASMRLGKSKIAGIHPKRLIFAWWLRMRTATCCGTMKRPMRGVWRDSGQAVERTEGRRQVGRSASMKARKLATRGYLWAILSATLPAAAQVGPELLQHWNYDPNQPLEVRQLGVQERHGVKLVELTYTSPVDDRGKAVGPNGGKVAAYLVLPPGKGPFPAVIYGHWCMPGSEKKNRTEFLEEALVLAQSGVISLLPDHVSVRPEFVEDPTPFSENQVAVTV